MEVMKFLEKQWKLVLGFFGVLVLVGALVAFLSYRSMQKEQSAQESYFAVEKKLLDLKNKKESQTADSKKEAKKEVIDYSQVKKELEKVMSDFPGSVASQMAALHFENLLIEDKNIDIALATLQKVENSSKGLVNTLVQQQIG